MPLPKALAAFCLGLLASLVVFLLVKPREIFASYTFGWTIVRPTLPPAPTAPPALVAPTVSPIIFKPIQVNTPTPSSTATPTIAPTPTPGSNTPTTPTPTLKPTLTPTPVSSTEVKKDFIMSAINAYRSSQGLPAVQTDPYTCSFAKLRASEIAATFNHDGFRNRINANSLPYPSYSKVTENIAMNSDYRRVVNVWINSPGHAANMRADTPFVCVESSGNYYSYEGWKP